MLLTKRSSVKTSLSKTSYPENTALLLLHGIHVMVPVELGRGVGLCKALQGERVPLGHGLGLGLTGDTQTALRPREKSTAAAWQNNSHSVIR